MEDIQSQIDELTQRMDDNDSTVQDLSDNTDSSIQDLQQAVQDQSDQLSTLNDNAGQLTFPLSQDTIDLINEQFPRGSVVLSGGTATLTDGRISANSTILHSIRVASSAGFIACNPGAGSATFTSTNGSDSSTVDYLILA